MKHSRFHDLFRKAVDLLAGAVLLFALGIFALNALSADRVEYKVRLDGQPARMSPAEFASLGSRGHRIGSRDAKVTMVVFSDYKCAFCAELHFSMVAVLDRYPDHFAVVVRHFGTPGAREDMLIPVASECAADVGGFFAYHQAAFESRRLTSYTDGWRMIADSAGLDTSGEFEECVRELRHADRDTRDFADAVSLGIEATPTSFLNGVAIVGAPTTAGLDSLVAAELARASGG